MAIILDGKKTSADLRMEIREKALDLKRKTGTIPGLAVILVGDDPASRIYVSNKEKACDDAGFLSREYNLRGDARSEDISDLIRSLNNDQKIHGILIQLPLPPHIRPEPLIELVDPKKDVDGFHPYNIGQLFLGNPYHRPCTPSGIVEILDRYKIEISGKEAVIVGRSNIVGKPLALMLLSRNATVTICHTKTRDLAEVTRRADILVAAVGKARMIRGDMVKHGAVVVDVGVNRLADGKVVGDVDFAEVSPKASYITPVPGGVGPMTIAMLLKNTLNAVSYAKIDGR
jgi:methylenetetrahydrofolate dehydrogenase (NADP+)/methenyltetrahydrofolate cyclohydrolase